MIKIEKAQWINIALDALAVIGIIVGLSLQLPLLIICLVIPAVIYEIYFAPGGDKSLTPKILMLLLIAELVLTYLNIRYDIAGAIGITNKKTVTLVNTFGRLDFLMLLVIAYFSFKFLFKAAGIRGKWLAILIFAGALASIQAVDPTVHQKLVDFFVNQVLGKIKFIVKILGL